MNKANLFIVGAPKCGTSALHDYLSQHNDFFMSSIKEPKYFADDMSLNFRTINNLNDYEKLFNSDVGVYRYYGEASPIYLSSSTAIKNIYNYNPEAKIIVMLRNPVDMMLSYHNQLVYNLNETEENFEKAWKLFDERQNGNNLPKSCIEPKLLNYKEIANLGSQLENIYKYFDKSNVFVIFYEDFSNNTKGVFEELLSFLDIKDKNLEKIDFKKINPRKTSKSKLLTKYINSKFNKTIVKYRKKSIFGGFGILNKLKEINMKEVPSSDISIKVRKIIVENYYNDIEKLESITGRDLSAWKKIY